MTSFGEPRRRMVERQIAARGICDALVLASMREVPREKFVPAELAAFAYDDGPLPIGQGQTISQPYIVALMIDALELAGEESVLEIGTGSGYAAAVLSRIASHIYTIERHADLADSARQRFVELGYDNIEVLHGDGTLGWPEYAPFDAIQVTAAALEAPPSLREQLKVGGRMVIPVGSDGGVQSLICETRLGEEHFESRNLGAVHFVPLVGPERSMQRPGIG